MAWETANDPCGEAPAETGGLASMPASADEHPAATPATLVQIVTHGASRSALERFGVVSCNVTLPILFGTLTMIGYCIPSAQYIAAVNSSEGLVAVRAMTYALLTWTPTNLLLVTIVACYMSIATATKLRGEWQSLADTWSDASLRGAVLWFATLAGAGWLEFSQVFEATNDSYVRLWCLVVGAGLAVSLAPKETVNRLLRIAT